MTFWYAVLIPNACWLMILFVVPFQTGRRINSSITGGTKEEAASSNDRSSDNLLNAGLANSHRPGSGSVDWARKSTGIVTKVVNLAVAVQVCWSGVCLRTFVTAEDGSHLVGGPRDISRHIYSSYHISRVHEKRDSKPQMYHT